MRDALAGTDAVIYAAGAVRGGCIDDFRPGNVHGVEAVALQLGRRELGHADRAAPGVARARDLERVAVDQANEGSRGDHGIALVDVPHHEHEVRRTIQRPR